MPEPMYIVIYRAPQANHDLMVWAHKHAVDHKHIDKNRLYIYTDHMFERFRVTWTRDWSQISVWDCWRRRHIDLD